MGTVVWTRGGEDPGGAIGEFDLEPVAGLVAAEEGGGFVLVEAGDDGEVGAEAGAWQRACNALGSGAVLAKSS